VIRHGWPDIDPAVLAQLRKIADIRENPYGALYRQIVLAHNQRASLFPQQGELIAPIFPVPSTAAEEFDSKIKGAVWVAHLSIALTNSKKLKARKQIARCAQELANALGALKRDEKDILVHFLPHRRQATFDDFLTATRELAVEARHICSIAGRPSGRSRRVTRHSFVTLILDAAAEAYGKLTLHPRSGRGTMVDAIKLLLPYLPEEIRKMPSFSTLKRLRKAWVQKRRKKVQRTPGLALPPPK
jgi:hypothetical protein